MAYEKMKTTPDILYFFPSVGLFVLKMCHSNVTALIFICRDHRLESVFVGMRYMVQQRCY